MPSLAVSPNQRMTLPLSVQPILYGHEKPHLPHSHRANVRGRLYVFFWQRRG